MIISMNSTSTRPRRRRRTAAVPRKENLTPFQSWMICCVAIPFSLVGLADDFSKDIPQCYRNQLGAGALMVSLAAATVFAGAGLGLWCILQGIALAMRKSQRPKYYPQEKARRLKLAEERRKIRKRRTLHKAPTADELMAQWAKIRKSPKEMIRFGSMLCDLEAYVDNTLVRDEYGEIVGRRPGIKGWLGENCPVLFAKYTTVMSYKAMAVKFRQAAGFADPFSPADALPEEEREQGETSGEEGKITVRKILSAEKRREIEIIFKKSGTTRQGLLEQLDERLNPERVPNIMGKRERVSQGVPQQAPLPGKIMQTTA